MTRPELHWRVDLRPVIALGVRRWTLRFTGIVIGRFGIGFIVKSATTLDLHQEEGK